jgi:hypothetical protein
MKDQVLHLIAEQTSPLFRIMSVYNHNEPARRKFENNITAFHIGNGLVLTVAHNLKLEAQLIKSIPEAAFQQSIIARCNEIEAALMNRCFFFDPATGKRYINITDQNDFNPAVETFKRINFDARWITQYETAICNPYLVIQFENNLFFNDEDLTNIFPANNRFHEPAIESYTFLIELELIEAFYAEDIAVYRMIHTDPAIVKAIPFAQISFETFITNSSLFCLQSSPSGTNLGRMINEARIEGVLDHHAVQPDRIGGNFIRKGLRYLIKGYFRFGSSGAPYFYYDQANRTFRANAIQSEASPIQLSIKDDKNGNFQYINAIASPVSLIEGRLNEIIHNEVNKA